MRRLVVCIIAMLWCACAPLAAQTRPPELPRTYLDSRLPAVTGRSVRVTVSGLQAAINAALPGDEIVCAPGKLTARLDFKNTPNLPGWITLRSANSGLLPPFGGRVSPADAANMVTVESPDTLQCLDFYPTYAPAGVTKAHHWIVIGFNLTPSPRYSINYGLAKLGATGWQTTAEQAPSDLWLDRCLIQGLPGGDIIRGVSLNGARESITGCWIGEIHARGNGDTQAICGWNGPGPFRIVNNYLEAAGENILMGGADSRIPGLVPADIEIRGNEFAKRPSWNPADPSYAGIHWGVKNLFELKNARRVLIDGNVMRGCWVDGQAGFAVQLTPRNQDGGAVWSTVEDVTFSNNRVRGAAGGVNLLGTDYTNPSGVMSRVLISGNLFEDIGGGMWGYNGRLIQALNGVVDLEVSHNTGFANHSFLLFDGAPTVRLSYTDNIVLRGDGGLLGSDATEGRDAFTRYAPDGVFLRNVIITTLDVAARYPAGNYFGH